MDDFDINEVKETSEYKFARDLIRFVLGTRMTGLNWVPDGVFEKSELAENLDSPFTPKIKATVELKLDLYEPNYHKHFDNNFPAKTVEREPYIELCKNLRAELLNREFSIKDFFGFSVVLAKYAGLSYLHGVVDGPKETHKIIVATVKRLKENRIINDHFWNELHDWSENPELTEDESDDSERTETASDEDTIS